MMAVDGTEPSEVRKIMQIEGHTHTVPIHTAQFDSNWDLSTARSVRVNIVVLPPAAAGSVPGNVKAER